MWFFDCVFDQSGELHCTIYLPTIDCPTHMSIWKSGSHKSRNALFVWVTIELLEPQILTMFHIIQLCKLFVNSPQPWPQQAMTQSPKNSLLSYTIREIICESKIIFFAAFLYDWHVMRIAFIVLLCLCFERLSALSLTCNYFLPSFLEHLKARAIIWSYCVLKPMRGFPIKCTKGVVHFYTILWGKIIHFPTWDIHL